MKFELENFHRNIDKNELLKDLKRVYHLLKKENLSLTYRSYNENGKYSSSIMNAHFGSWNNALASAQIKLNQQMNISNEDLFVNLEQVWISLGRQPVTRDLVKPLSKYTHAVYSLRFGGWRKALEAFVEFINADEDIQDSCDELKPRKELSKASNKRRTNRNISDRMRFRILSRDGFTCQSCGASPIKKRGIELHVDHIIPWSKGGCKWRSKIVAFGAAE